MKQILTLSIGLFVVMISLGVNTLMRGIQAHRTFTIVTASLSITGFLLAIGYMLYIIRKESKAAQGRN